MKVEDLLRLANERKKCHLPGYTAIGDFDDGIFECDHVSPWTKSGSNTDAELMIIGQDWSSVDALAKLRVQGKSAEVAKRGYDAKFQTNRNLDEYLRTFLSLSRRDCYLTNLFPFLKSGNATARIAQDDLERCAECFTVNEIKIVQPVLAICLGLTVFLAIHSVVLQPHRKTRFSLDEAIRSPFVFAGTEVCCVAHTGARGTNGRGRAKVEADWKSLADRLGYLKATRSRSEPR